MVSIFSEVFGINTEDVVDELAYDSIQAWNSVAHMAMVAEAKEVFDIMMDTDDIIDIDEAVQDSDMKRAAEPSDMANVAAFLISDSSSYITGETIRVDGGMY